MQIVKFGHKIEFELYSGSCPPGSTGMMTSDMATWYRMDEGEWFKCILRSQLRVLKLFDLAENEEDLKYIFNELKYEHN